MAFPVVQMLRFPVDTDPSGYRNVAASGQILNTTITGLLDFGNINTTTSGGISDTALTLFRVDDLGSASGVYNLRFYLQSASAFSTGNYRFLHRINTHYQGVGFRLSLADADVPTVLPAQNVLSTSGQPTLSGIFDGHVSQYIYLAIYADTDVPFGIYGSAGTAGIRYSLVYDFS